MDLEAQIKLIEKQLVIRKLYSLLFDKLQLEINSLYSELIIYRYNLNEVIT